MEFRTAINIVPSDNKIGYQSPVMFLGSCFSAYIGERFRRVKMPVLINPTGTLYNPVSVATLVDAIIDDKRYVEEELYFHNGKWISFDHYGDFSSSDRSLVLSKINNSISEASAFLKNAKFLFITFGTARVYRHNITGKVVSNCHKIPAHEFTRELLSGAEIKVLWEGLLKRLSEFNGDLSVVFTVSPVRHLKDGAHGNQLSKSVLMVAIEELLNKSTHHQYFPAYEIMMDDLRDYRFYGNDLIHPSEMAIDYIWEKFSKCYFWESTIKIQNDFEKLHKSMSHRLQNGTEDERKSFVLNSQNLINQLTAVVPGADLSKERDYFSKLG